MPRHSPIKLGVINLGTDWHGPFEGAFVRLADRVRVTAVIDEIALRALQVAESLGARAMHGIRELVYDPDVSALMVFDPGWRRDWLLAVAAATAKPLLLVHPGRFSREALREVALTADHRGLIAMPLVPLRWTPVTIRLRELMATRLGPAHEARLDVGRLCHSLDCCGATPIEAFDWFRSLVTTSGCEIDLDDLPDDASTCAPVLARVRSGRSGDVRVTCEFHWNDSAVAPLRQNPHRGSRSVPFAVGVDPQSYILRTTSGGKPVASRRASI